MVSHVHVRWTGIPSTIRRAGASSEVAATFTATVPGPEAVSALGAALGERVRGEAQPLHVRERIYRSALSAAVARATRRQQPSPR